MSKTRDLLLKRKAEIREELARVAEPLMEEYREVKMALDAINSASSYGSKYASNTVITPSSANPLEKTDAEYVAEMEAYFGNRDCPPDPREFVAPCHAFKDHYEGCDKTCNGCEICRREWWHRDGYW